MLLLVLFTRNLLPCTFIVAIPIKLEFSVSVGFIHKESITMHLHSSNTKKVGIQCFCWFYSQGTFSILFTNTFYARIITRALLVVTLQYIGSILAFSILFVLGGSVCLISPHFNRRLTFVLSSQFEEFCVHLTCFVL